MKKNTEVKCHFWPIAYHRWKPVPNFDLSRAVEFAVQPNPNELSMVFLAGEAFSSYQAWMEGALETAELALKQFFHARAKGPSPAKKRNCMLVEGRLLDVASWKHVHPGSTKAITGHLNEDVGDLLHHFGHSAHAWAVVHSLKVK
jgi:hypothetical protein